MAWPRVLIAGGSIGGLTTGVLLSELGCDVEIFERSDRDLEDRGAGIVVLPVTERYFERGINTGPKRVSLELTYWNYVDETGKVVASHEDHFRFSGWSTIYRALLEVFERDRYHYGHEVSGLSQTDDRVTLHLADGRTFDGDMAVFADGMGSTGRSILLPDVTPDYAGYVAWRGIVPEAELSGAAQTLVADAMVYQVLGDGHILVYAIPNARGNTMPPERVINFVWYRNYPEDGSFEDLMTDSAGQRRAGTMPPGEVRAKHIDELHRTASAVLAPQLAEIVTACRAPMIQAVFDVSSPRMVFGRSCLIGDAATTLRPHVAAGQAKACADAWALRDALAETAGDVDEAFATWEPTQLELARTALARTREMGIASQFERAMTVGDPDWKFGLWEPGN